MPDIYNINNLEILSAVRVPSGAEKNKKIHHNPYLKCYELFICLSGSETVFFQNRSYIQKSDTVTFLPKQIENNTYYVTCDEKSEYIDIYFNTDSPLPKNAFSNDFSSNPKIRRLFLKIQQIWDKKQLGYRNKCISVFYDILYQMEKTNADFTVPNHRKKIASSVDYIHNHYFDLDFDYKRLGTISNVSYTYFKKLFMEIYNITPFEYVKSLRLTRACELLSTNHFSISQIAEMCGYSNIYYFSKVFKSEMGITPSEHIKSFSKN